MKANGTDLAYVVEASSGRAPLVQDAVEALAEQVQHFVHWQMVNQPVRDQEHCVHIRQYCGPGSRRMQSRYCLDDPRS